MRVERADGEDIAGLAWLKWQDVAPEAKAGRSLDLFTDELATWWRAHADTHSAFVARTDDGEIVGMAWLALLPRVPRPGAADRVSADIQSVFVLPAHRGCGIGSRLIAAACAYGTSLGAPRITVHSSDGAVRLYRRLGFSGSAQLLQLRGPA
ncbi:GNAT family N-acetyltransferase [Microbacterium sp. NPDC055988]|uniref:GNAT family N-acetyltransferase n=1 Tax=Microbacterium sp. NPDC055988 TaxID=3345671 RepID=UPI0035DE0B33